MYYLVVNKYDVLRNCSSQEFLGTKILLEGFPDLFVFSIPVSVSVSTYVNFARELMPLLTVWHNY